MQQDREAAVISRAGVVVVGLAAVVYGAYHLQKLLGFLASTLAHMPEEGVGWDDWLVLFAALLGPVIMLGTGLLLVRWSDAISRKHFSHIVGAEIVVYRAAFAVIGLFFISVAFTRLLTLLTNIATRFFSDFPDESEMGPLYFWPWLVSALVNLCIGVYFFLGAPGLLGWHLKRCKDVDRSDGTS